MRKPKLAAKRLTWVNFTIRRFNGTQYGRFWFHNHAALERTFCRAPVLKRKLKFTFQETQPC